MMTLKYPEPATCLTTSVCRDPVLFTLPPQGVATIGEMDSLALDSFCQAIRERLSGPVSLTTHPHRIGSRSSVALHLEGRLGSCIDVLITVNGNTLWPELEEYKHPRWYVTVPDAADVVYLLLHLNHLFWGSLAV
ncbi:acetyltransferase [Serratia quinivorans]|jgi:hypothetical protein|uniref:acetyltransferase n=1 Tax=Serratia quinivorans TaxID=137545 RepID=UPI00217A9C5E|nr:acetyltransferase [Serratia quinivorans]CAI0967047.1 Uncharacterised protein [Serratia quinivorans]CAI1714674.1 Uncharacterised protein [Serratia quinivorans]